MSLNLKIQREKSRTMFLMVLLELCDSARNAVVFLKSQIFHRIVRATVGQMLGSRPGREGTSQMSYMDGGATRPNSSHTCEASGQRSAIFLASS